MFLRNALLFFVIVFLVDHDLSTVQSSSVLSPVENHSDNNERQVAAQSLRDRFYGLFYNGHSAQLMHEFSSLHSRFGTLHLDEALPSLYNLQAVLLFYSNRKREAFAAFQEAVRAHPEDLRALVNLVEVARSYQDLADEASAVMERLSGRADRGRKAAAANWSHFEEDQFVDTQALIRCVREHRDEDRCDMDLLNMNLLLFPPVLFREYLEFTADNAERDRQRHLPHTCERVEGEEGNGDKNPTHLCSQRQLLSSHTQYHHSSRDHDKLRIGVLLPRNDLNPVNILAYSLFKALPRERLQLVVFFLNNDEHQLFTDWQRDFFASFDAIVDLHGKDAISAAREIAHREIDVLLEMNGITLTSCSSILAQRPAPLQISFLGDPITSGAPYIDFFVGDPHSVSVESMRNAFSESLLLLPTCYLANSHAVSQKHLLERERISRADFARHLLSSPSSLSGERIVENDDLVVLGAFHGWTKIDPTIFTVWMNILRAAPLAVLVLWQNKGSSGFENMQREMLVRGVLPRSRAGFLIPSEFEEHLHVKSGMDLFLDTVLKNGHSTTLDAHWAALPVLALAGRDNMNSRSSESAAYYNENEHGMAYSLKEYEDRVLWLLKTPEGRRALRAWRKHSERQREDGMLFDFEFFAAEFGRLMQVIFDESDIRRRRGRHRAFHVFASDAV